MTTSPPPAVALALETSDGVRLMARRWPASDAPHAAVVLVHGFAGSSDEPRVIALAEALAALGHTVLAYDARGHGASGGASTLGFQERLDVEAAVAAARAEGLPVIVVGESMGAIAVLWALAKDPALADGVVTLSCTSRWRLPFNARGLLAALVTQTALGRWVAREHMKVRIARRRERPPPPVEMVRSLRVPIAVVHGRRDPFIPCGDAEELHAAAPQPRRLSLIDAMAHSFEPSAVQPVLDAVRWVLDPRG